MWKQVVQTIDEETQKHCCVWTSALKSKGQKPSLRHGLSDVCSTKPPLVFTIHSQSNNADYKIDTITRDFPNCDNVFICGSKGETMALEGHRGTLWTCFTAGSWSSWSLSQWHHWKKKLYGKAEATSKWAFKVVVDRVENPWCFGSSLCGITPSA